jgi:hypothetical protein
MAGTALTRAASARYRAKNRERLCAAERQARQNNLEAIRAQEHAFRLANRQAIRDYAAANREAARAASRKHYAANKRKILDAHKAFADRDRTKHREMMNAASAKWRGANREKTRQSDRSLAKRVSSQVYKSLKKRAGTDKCGASWQVLLGYDLGILRRHIERQFSPGMTWENMGAVWHVDHIRPVRAFTITGPACPELRACWALSNLRPLPAVENMSKGGRITLLL